MSRGLDRPAVHRMITNSYETYIMMKLAPVAIDHLTDYAMTLMTPGYDHEEFIAKLGLYIDLIVGTWEPQPPVSVAPPTIQELYTRPGVV